MWNFQILIVSAVKICKQYLQTASVSEGLRSQTFYRGTSPLNTTGDFHHPDPHSLYPTTENSWPDHCRRYPKPHSKNSVFASDYDRRVTRQSLIWRTLKGPAGVVSLSWCGSDCHQFRLPRRLVTETSVETRFNQSIDQSIDVSCYGPSGLNRRAIVTGSTQASSSQWYPERIAGKDRSWDAAGNNRNVNATQCDFRFDLFFSFRFSFSFANNQIISNLLTKMCWWSA